MSETIISIAGKPGLFKLISRGKSTLIVETLDPTHRRQPAFAHERVTALTDITMFTTDDDIRLGEVLIKMRDKEQSHPSSLNWRKATPAELQSYFADILPNFDRDRVHSSDIKKLIQWYNILVDAGMTNFEETLLPKNDDAPADASATTSSAASSAAE